MKVLFVTESWPTTDVAHGDGSTLIAAELLPRLVSDSTIVVTFGCTSGSEAPLRATEVVRLPTRKRQHALALAACGRPHVGTFERYTPSNRGRVRELSESADVTFLHGPHVLAFAQVVRGPVVAQVVDPWSRRLLMEAEMASGLRAQYLRARAGRVLEWERRMPASATLLTVSEDDATWWASRLGRPVLAIPNGVEQGPPPTRRARSTPRIGFFGSLDYAPNVDSAQIVGREIAPAVRRTIADCEVVVAGRSPAEGVQELASIGVTVLADVPFMTDVIDSLDVAVFPDRFGLGVRNSVREALVRGVEVVASPVAARGTPVAPNLHVVDSVADASRVIVSLLQRREPRATFEPLRLPSWDDAAHSYQRALESARSAWVSSP